MQAVAIGVVAFFFILALIVGPGISERIEDTNDHRRQIAAIERERAEYDLERYKDYHATVQPATEIAGILLWFILPLACICGLSVLMDAYRQRRTLIYPNKLGVWPADRRLLNDEVLTRLLLESTQAYHATQIARAQHQPGQLPVHYSPQYAPHFEYDYKSASTLTDGQPPALTLPDSIKLADVMHQIPRGSMAYGVLPNGELLKMRFGAAHHSLGHGDTRTGKTNWIDSQIVQIHYQAQHYPVNLYAGDFKRELAATWRRSELMIAVETDPAAIADILEEIVNGQDGILARYSLFERIGAEQSRIIRNIGDYARIIGRTPRLTFMVIDEINALLEACDRRESLAGALTKALQLGAGAGFYIIGGAQHLSSNVFRRDGSKQFVTRAHFGAYDKNAVEMMFSCAINKDIRPLITGQPGRGLIRTVGQAEPVPFQALLCDESDILEAIGQPAGIPHEPESHEPMKLEGSASETVETGFSPPPIQPEIAAIVRRLRNTKHPRRDTNYNQKEIIQIVWGASAGGTDDYKAAREQYRQIIEEDEAD